MSNTNKTADDYSPKLALDKISSAIFLKLEQVTKKLIKKLD